ncbi:MAG: hypothetical protein KJZ84_00035 [Bryobacteraceae bacterium]|nr:hypothetical protein [Bryobacteraceae bacterium]
MNALKPMGLLASGRMSDSTLLRVPQLGSAFGPVVASSKRLASRYANYLRLGRAAGDLEALAPCRLIWLQVPEHELASTQLALLRTKIQWRGKTVVLVDPGLDCSALGALAAKGAAVASLTHLPLRQEQVLLVEGETQALRPLRLVWRNAGVRAIELKPGLKQVYAAGIMAAESLAAPLVDSALACLRLAGLDPAAAKRLAGALVEAAVREQIAHGRKSWISPASPPRRELTLRQIGALNDNCPGLATYLRSVLNATLDWYNLTDDQVGNG